jgi:hypothetical protein
MAQFTHQIAQTSQVACSWSLMDPFSLSNISWGLVTLAAQPPMEWLQVSGVFFALLPCCDD